MRSHLSLPLILTMGFLSPLAPAAYADGLSFYNNWFLTGDYAVAGTGLKNTGGIGTINLSGVPCTSGIGPSAAIVPCTNAGAVPAYPIAAFLYWETVENTAAAAAVNGVFDGSPITGIVMGTDASTACWVNAPKQTLRAYRADVLRFLPFDPASQLRRANGAHSIKLGNAVSGNTGVLPSGTLGASLVVIYRVVVAGKPLIMPLRSVVIYDGEKTLSKSNSALIQTIAGFYQSAGPSALPSTMTQIAGNGQSSFNTVLRVNHDNIGTHQFPGSAGPNWDNPTYNISLNKNDASFTTEMDAENNATCLAFGAIVTSTPVVDSDNDGLLDIWETGGIHRNTQASPATFGACADYPNEPCVNLPAMGAKNGVQDIFLQMDWMHGFGDRTGGIDGTGNHSHAPKLDALTMVANVFARHNIAVHFDVGSNYQGLGLPYIVPAPLAQGGSDLDESTLRCSSGNCSYTEPYPVLSFKLGFNSIRDGNHLLHIPAHFSQSRKDAFHYVLFAHALAGPFDLAGKPITADPKSISGIGDRPGGDAMVSLGLWRSDIPANDQVGSALVQAGTLMHELGHNLDLSHGGWSSQPNCVPNYPSVMSYLYQTRGLTDANGVAQIDFSTGSLAPLNEASISTSAILGALKYRVRFYTPFNPALNSVGQGAKLHCDGTPITDGALEVRSEGPAVSTPDWSNGLYPPGTAFPLDVNFDGIAGQSLLDQPDWSSLNFQQIGSRTNFGSLSSGSLATDAGSLATDAGSLATDAGSLATDAGSLATDAGSLATDAGSLATDAGSLATDAGDEDYDTHIRSTTDRIPSAQQCAGCGLTATNGLSAITLSWTPPDTGGSLTYMIYRCVGTGCTPSVTPFLRNYVPASKSTPTFTDTVNDFVNAGASCPAAATCYNTIYTYAATAVSTAGIESPYSNTASSEVTHLFVIADNQAVVYGSPNPAPSFKVYGDIGGSLNNTLVSCAYPGVPRNAGSYAITCTGPASTSPANGVTYNAAYIIYSPGSLTISKRPVTVTAAAANKIYDGLTASTAAPTITSGALAYSDSVTWTETYDNRNVGAAHLMTPVGTISDGNGGNNYAVTFVSISTGVITVRPITVTAAASTKIYDGNTSSTALPAITTNSLGAGDTAVWTETYDNRNVGATHVMTPAGTVSDGNNGNNYAVTFVSISTGVITVRPITVTAAASTKVYDGNTSSTAIPAITTNSLVTGDTAAWTETYDTKNVGATHVMTPAGTISDGNNGNNYAVTFAPIATGVITARPLTVTAAASTKVYDGNTSSTSIPTITSGSLISGDTAAWTETYDNKNVGVTHVMTPAGTISDGNNGNNYAVTFATIATGVITPRSLIASITANNKQYDGTIAATIATRTLTGAVPLDTVSLTSGLATFADKNVGAPKTVTAVGLSLSGTDSINYTVNSTATTTANITPTPLTIKADNKSIGDDDPTPPLTATYLTLLGGDTPSSLTGTLVCTTTRRSSSPVGTYSITCSGKTSANYTITYVAGTLTVFLN
uniref:Uncharacterized protein n=1 Tax=Solibacter usitatus (strain Ellin6076) TaxID=234267 RepID=Q01ZI3_SOLUE